MLSTLSLFICCGQSKPFLKVTAYSVVSKLAACITKVRASDKHPSLVYAFTAYLDLWFYSCLPFLLVVHVHLSPDLILFNRWSSTVSTNPIGNFGKSGKYTGIFRIGEKQGFRIQIHAIHPSVLLMSMIRDAPTFFSVNLEPLWQVNPVEGNKSVRVFTTFSYQQEKFADQDILVSEVLFLMF